MAVQEIKSNPEKLNGSFIFREEITPISVLRDPNDDNRKFLMTGSEIDFKQRTVNGEVVEISSDTDPETSSFTTAFDSAEIT